MSGDHNMSCASNGISLDDEMDHDTRHFAKPTDGETDPDSDGVSEPDSGGDTDPDLSEHDYLKPQAVKHLVHLTVCGLLPLDIDCDMFFNAFVYTLEQNNVNDALNILAKIVCYRDVSPRIVTIEEFNKFIRVYTPDFNVSYEDLSAYCVEVYKTGARKIKEMLNEAGGQISLSVDMSWHERNSGEISHFLALYAHFIDKDSKLRKWGLKLSSVYDCRNFPADTIVKALKEFDILNKVSSITAANGYSDDDLVYLVRNEVKVEGLLLSGQLSRVYCCSDMISLLVQDAFKEIASIISKVEELYHTRSQPLWIHTLGNLRKALELESTGEYSSDHIYSSVPSPEEWDKVRCICRVVGKVYDIVKGLFDAKQQTANIYLPHLLELRSFLIQESSSPDGFAKVIATKMRVRFDKYWSDMHLVLAISAFMDPRYKMKYLEFSSSKAANGFTESEVSSVLEAIRNIFKNYDIQNNAIPDQYCTDDTETETTSASLELLQQYCEEVRKPSDGSRKSELDLYLEEPVLPWAPNFCVLRWWKEATFKYPNLSRMARDFLAVPVSVSTSSDAYYTEPRPADPSVATLKPELRSALVCGRSWAKSYGGGTTPIL